MSKKINVTYKRIYDDASASDGQRVLVDRLWPRGVAKDSAQLDNWLKELAPSSELREWFHEKKDSRYHDFAKKYQTELQDKDKKAMLTEAVDHRHSTITLLTAAKDVEHSHIPTLQKFVKNNL